MYFDIPEAHRKSFLGRSFRRAKEYVGRLANFYIWGSLSSVRVGDGYRDTGFAQGGCIRAGWDSRGGEGNELPSDPAIGEGGLEKSSLDALLGDKLDSSFNLHSIIHVSNTIDKVSHLFKRLTSGML